MNEIAAMIADEFNPMGFRAPRIGLGAWPAWFLSFFLPELRSLLTFIDKDGTALDVTPSKEVLKLQFHSVKDMVSEGAHSVVYHGLVEKTPKYHSKWVPPGA